LKIQLFFFNPPTYFLWNNHLIPFKIRSLIKNIITINELSTWSSLKFFNNIPNIEWSLMFKTLNSLEHNSQLYSFRIKILTNNLPTMQNLNIRYPYLYTTSICCQCPNVEDTLYILICTKNTINIQQALLNIINNTLTTLNISSISSTILLNILLHFTLNTTNLQYHHILNLLVGTISSTTFNNIKILTKKQTIPLLINLSNNLLSWFFNEIWFSRNIAQHQWETARNITPKSKRTKLFLPTISSVPNTNPTTTPTTNNSSAIEKWLLQGYSLTFCFI